VTTRFAFWLPVLGLALALAISVNSSPLARADDPKDTPKEAEAKLPKGAKLRLNDGTFVYRFAPQFMLQPPDYKTLVLLAGPEALCRYDIATRKPLDKEPAKVPGFVPGAFILSGDGKRFVSSHTGILTVRETATNKAINQLKPPGGFTTVTAYNNPVTSLSADGKIMAQGGIGEGNKGGIVVWDVEKAEAIFQTGGSFNGAAAPTISPDGKLVAVRALNAGFRPPGAKTEDDPTRMVWVYEVESGKELLKGQVTPFGFQGMTALVFSPDNTTLAASFGDGLIDLFDLKTGKAKPVILGGTGQGVRIAFSADSKTIAATSNDGTIQRWNLADGKSIDVTDGPPALVGPPQGIVFADNRVLAWGAAGGYPLVWEAPSGKMLTQLPAHTQAIKSIGFTSDGKEIITSGQDGRVVRWDASTGKHIGEVTLKPSRTTLANAGVLVSGRLIVDITPDATRAVTLGTVSAVMDLGTAKEEFSIPRGSGNYASTQVHSADATKVMVVTSIYIPNNPPSAKCVVWDLNTRQKLLEAEMNGGLGYQTSFSVSPSGKRAVITGYKQPQPGMPQMFMVTGWDLKTGKKLSEIEDVATNGTALVTAVSDSFAVVHSASGRIRAYDYETGRGGDELATGKERPEPIAGPVVVIADGKQFVSTGPAEERGLYEVRIHEWPTGKVLHTFTGHRGPITAITLSPDGKTLATGAQDATVLLWDMSEVK
jgi:WD40 repeat protein